MNARTFPLFSLELVAVVADAVVGKGDPLTTTELGAVHQALEDFAAVLVALDVAGVRSSSPAVDGKPPAAVYNAAQRVEVLAADRNRADSTAEHIRDSLKTALARLAAIESGPKGAAWASLEAKARQAQAWADALERQVADLEATEKTLRERIAVLEPMTAPVPDEPPDLMPPPPPDPTKCPKSEWCGLGAGHSGECNEADLPF